MCHVASALRMALKLGLVLWGGGGGFQAPGPGVEGEGGEGGGGKCMLGGALRERSKEGSEGDHSHLHHPKNAVSAKPGRCPPGLGLRSERTAESGHKRSLFHVGTAVSKGLLL